jgi:alpha-glucosidase (family GH31 glycosyl hydrolase)
MRARFARAPRVLVLAPFFAFAACGDNATMMDPCGSGSVPDSFTISASGVSVSIQSSPYRYTVSDGSGKAVLTSSQQGDGSGWGALGWTTGTTSWRDISAPGYFEFDPAFDPWRDQLKVVAVEKQAGDRLDLTLSSGEAGRCVHVSHQLRDSTLRVEAHADGNAPRAWSSAFSTPDANEAFIGFGERYNKVNQRGNDLYCWPEEGGLSKGEKAPAGPTNPYPNGGTMTYYPVPFLVSSTGYGFWLDSTWRSEFNLASDMTHPSSWRAWQIGPTSAYEIYLPLANDKRPWPYHVVDEFTKATGRPMIPPSWSFGPRRRINRGAMVNNVLEAQAMRDQDLALTVVDDTLHFLPAGNDIGIESDVKAWTASMRALGLRMCGYYNPYLVDDMTAANWSDTMTGLADHYFLADAAGDPSKVFLISGKPLNVYTVDVTSPKASAWFTNMFQRAIDLGYTGWMYDFGEYVQPEDVSSTGMTGEELHDLFPVLYDKVAHDALEAGQIKGDWYFYARSGFTGSSQYTPMVWSGDPDASFSDAEGIPAQVRAGINGGLSGLANWGSDIGGFKCLADGSGAADGEVLTRWIEMGAMCSNMHDDDACSGGSGNPPKATIWSSMDARTAWGTYAKLHTRMLPYFQALAVEANATGAPVIRSMFFEHPERNDFASVDDTYYLGRALLVAPVVKRGAVTRDIDFPTGNFLDWSAGTLVAGGSKITVDAPLSKLPLYLVDGQLLPLLDPSVNTLDPGKHASAIGPDDVPDVIDVVALLSQSAGTATITLPDGSNFTATLTAPFAAPALMAAADEMALASCSSCWLDTPASNHVHRVRLTIPDGDTSAGGLALHSKSNRRVRWDLYLVE